MKAKKIFGQHFLHDEAVIQNILQQLPNISAEHVVIEIGPGQGILTQHLIERYGEKLYAVEVDKDMVNVLQQKFPQLGNRLLHQDVLKFDMASVTNQPVFIIGNFPYNISSQIVFQAIDHRQQVTHLLGMFQKEMALRVVSPPGSKDYGIISVLCSAYFQGQYLFDVAKESFNPPPNVMSGVISLQRNAIQELPCNEVLFIKVVKAAFNQRRKMLRNSLSSIIQDKIMLESDTFTKRPEQLSLHDFIAITQQIQN
jgi:16S rRNA (adenine1518-N6/adenine1519-N6)-dimethyltransferase